MAVPLKAPPPPLDLIEVDNQGDSIVQGDPTPVGGRVALFISNWRKITSDPFVLSVIKDGFQISVLDHFPGVIRKVTVTPSDPKVVLRIREEIQDLILKRAIVQINDSPNLCLSPIFVIPKSSGDLRVILNLKEFNLYLATQHFRMETLSVILPQLAANDWAVSIDLKDAYLHIPIHPGSRRFLGFHFMGKFYQYQVLPFGLKDSPWVFTRVVATLVGHLRRLGLRIFYYLDDWLLVAGSRELLESHLQLALLWTQDLGFLVNWKKSSLTPQRVPSFLGAHLDIPNLLARPVERRVLALQAVIQELTSSPFAPALLWQKFLGHLASFVDLVPNCRLLMRPLQLHFLRFFTPLTDPQDKLVPMSPEILVLCRAWASPSRLLVGKPFAPPPPSLVITTDASRLGWGAVLHSHRVSGVWSKKESLDHINSLELKAVFLALQNLESHVLGHSVLIRSDNMTVVSFINHQGGTHSSSLCHLTLDLWDWCLLRGIFLHAAHIPGEENLVADFLSRGKFLPSEWVLDPGVFRKICQVSSPPPEIDLFASALNFRLPKYCSRCPDAQAWRIDALSFPWRYLRLYAFPPFSLLPRILDKVAQDQADLLLVAPYWPQRPWFPRLLSLLVGLPKTLPVLEDLIVQPLSLTPHPRVESLHLSLWPLSGSKEKRLVFLNELRNLQLSPLESPPVTLMIPDWKLSESGVLKSLAIPLLPL